MTDSLVSPRTMRSDGTITRVVINHLDSQTLREELLDIAAGFAVLNKDN